MKKSIRQTMTEHDLFSCPYASFTNTQLPLLQVAAVYFGKSTISIRAARSWATICADHHARDTFVQLEDAGILQTVTPAENLAKVAGPRLCVHHSHPRRRMVARLAQRQENGLHYLLSL